ERRVPARGSGGGGAGEPVKACARDDLVCRRSRVARDVRTTVCAATGPRWPDGAVDRATVRQELNARAMPAGHGISDRAAVEGGRATRKLRRDVSPAWHPHHALSGRGGRGRLSRP